MPSVHGRTNTCPNLFVPKCAEREAINRSFFGNQMSLADRKKMLQEYDIAYILTRRKYDFQPIAELIVDQKGGYLYRVKEENR